MAVAFAGKPSIRLATVGRGRRPPRDCVTTMCQTLRGGHGARGGEMGLAQRELMGVVKRRLGKKKKRAFQPFLSENFKNTDVSEKSVVPLNAGY